MHFYNVLKMASLSYSSAPCGLLLLLEIDVKLEFLQRVNEIHFWKPSIPYVSI